MPNGTSKLVIYEINAWVWLDELSRHRGRRVTFGSVPEDAWDGLERMGIDAVWFMGVWERSPMGRTIALSDAGIMADIRRALPDFSPEDMAGSPYCIRDYVVDPHLGGPEGLAAARRSLSRRGIRLILDFVPNHVAPDHPWTARHPEFFISGQPEDLEQNPDAFLAVGGNIFARGRDPFFPAWPDVLQLNVFHPGLRLAIEETLLSLAAQCDGLRCDMAMLVMNEIFGKTWKGRVGSAPPEEYWPGMIRSVRRSHPGFLFFAEAYWNREWDLQQQGFDYCYDKRLYDRLVHENAETVRLHLSAGLPYQERLVRFIENHDEPRAATAFSPDRERTAAVTMATVPGAALFHEGQWTGRRTRLPVFLGRRPEEPADPALQSFYDRLLAVIRMPCLTGGEWALCECRGWSDNATSANLLAWRWCLNDELLIVAVNFSGWAAQGRIQLAGLDLPGGVLRLTDLMTDALYERDGREMAREGLFVDLPPWAFHILHLRNP